MSVSCTFPLDYTVTADYPFLPQINMQVYKFNVSGHGEFSAIMQLYEDETYESAYTTVPEIKEEEMLNVGISLIESQVKICLLKSIFDTRTEKLRLLLENVTK